MSPLLRENCTPADEVNTAYSPCDHAVQGAARAVAIAPLVVLREVPGSSPGASTAQCTSSSSIGRAPSLVGSDGFAPEDPNRNRAVYKSRSVSYLPVPVPGRTRA